QMYNTYLQLLQDWKQAEGTVFMHFTDISISTKYGSWGALESVFCLEIRFKSSSSKTICHPRNKRINSS
ncbi:MAG: hypothetical protein ACKPH7_18980, partial [Planktothrix sp.]|uniref:hypothetical protein n=1 Tax=Planktothrix sp. TaxID=3088171 RepID=UPI0038D44575